MKTVLFVVLLLVGCSSIKGVEITDHERKACEASGCTVWTAQELDSLARRFFLQGYNAGAKSI